MKVLDILKKMRYPSSPLSTLQRELRDALNEVESLDWCLLPQEGQKDLSSEAYPVLLSQLDSDLENLAHALKYNTSVKRLDLRGHQIGDAGIYVLATMLRENTTVTSLFIQGNDITEKGLSHLLNALHFNKTLLNLDPQQEAMMKPHCDLSQRFGSDCERISYINSQICNIRSKRISAEWTWPLGNQFSIASLPWCIELLLFNQRHDAERQLEKTRKMNASIRTLSESLAYEQIKKETASGALVGVAVVGAGAFFGLVGAPAALPIVFSLGALGAGIAALKSSVSSFPKAARIIHTQIGYEENVAPAFSEKEALEDEPVIIETPIDHNLRIPKRQGFTSFYRR